MRMPQQKSLIILVLCDCSWGTGIRSISTEIERLQRPGFQVSICRQRVSSKILKSQFLNFKIEVTITVSLISLAVGKIKLNKVCENAC